MSSVPAAPPSGHTDGGGARRAPGALNRERRRAKNRRYHRNRTSRSHLIAVCWNAEGLRTKLPELQRWLPSIKADVLAVQEVQFPQKSLFRLPGFQPPVIVRRARGRVAGGGVKGGDVAVFVRAGLHFTILTDPLTAPNDDCTEVCGVRLLGERPLTIINLYRPPIRGADDERIDRFDPSALPVDDTTLLMGDFNAHHPQWDLACDEGDEVGTRVAEWLDSVNWTTLNSGEPTHVSYRSGSQTAPDLVASGASLARRSTWCLGPDLGSDHLPMIVEVSAPDLRPRRIRKTRWSFQKADWAAFRAECEAAFEEAGPPQSAQALSTHFTAVLHRASVRHIPRGARADPKPWALDPELRDAIAERREARGRLRQDDPTTKTRWIEAKRRAASVERRVSQNHFRDFVGSTLNKPESLGKVAKILKKWEGAPDEHRPGEAMEDSGRLLITDTDKAAAFNRQYAQVSRQVRDRTLDRAATRTINRHRRCTTCDGTRTGCCGEFSMEELTRQLQRCQLRKSPGPDELTAEHLKHLGPNARQTLLRLINKSWMEGAVPSEWRRATIIPIPKSGKDKRLLASYRPIALTSHIAKLMERLVLARLNYIANQLQLIPPEQVGFREGRSVEDNLGRLIQVVQDGWNRPKSRRKDTPDGLSAQKYALLAFDFSRAYDTVDHRLLRARLLDQGLPRCLVQWVWQFLRDRRARVEVNGSVSGERVYRAGLPQGSVLAPTLFLLWSASLAPTLNAVPGVTSFLYADDTAALCAGNDIRTATRRAQLAADALVQWARRSKMLVAGEKTQLLVLSQAAADSAGCAIKVAGKTVTAADNLKLLGVSFDRLLHFGAHCRGLRARVRPRTLQLRKLTGRSWGLEERQLRTVATGYVRGALEHAAAAWLPATPRSHVELLEREMRAAARAVTGCPLSTPAHAVMAEAGLVPVSARRTTLAAKFLAKACALPRTDPLRRVAEADPPHRLKSVTGWRRVGREAWQAAGIAVPVEPLLPDRAPPWEGTASPLVSIRLDVGAPTRDSTTEATRQAAQHHLASLPQRATWIWTDGSADGGVRNGGAGAFIEWPDGATQELRTPAGLLCSSYRAELVALLSALQHLQDNPQHTQLPIVCCTDSQSALAALREGPQAQRSPLGASVWAALAKLASPTRRVFLQWVPSHCGIEGNERADSVAKEAAALPQEQVPVDVTTVHRAAARAARERAIAEWPEGWYRSLMGDRMPPPVTAGDRSSAVDVHQLRAGHWSGSCQYLHRIGRNPTNDCRQCSDSGCPAGRCIVCREEADTPHHILLRCPALMERRLRRLGTICPTPQEVRDDGEVAALAAAMRALQSRLATPRL